MFKEILQIVPKLSGNDLSNMERSLQSRFSKIAKTFGKGLAGVLTGGSIIGAAAALLQKALNPLQEIQAAIERTLDKGSELTSQAAQFGSNPGELAKLHAFGAAKGVSDQELNVLITKFQTAVTDAIAKPGEVSPVRAFTGDKDSVASFFSFIQSLSALGKTNKNEQLRVQNAVFGERQVLKMSEFLNSDFHDLVKAFSDINSEQLGKDITKLNRVHDLHNQLQAHTDLADLGNKAKNISKDQAIALDESRRTQLGAENKKIADFRGLIDINDKMEKIQNQLEEVSRDVLLKLPIITDGLQVGIDLLKKSVEGWKMTFDLMRPFINDMKKSRIFRGIFGGKDE